MLTEKQQKMQMWLEDHLDEVILWSEESLHDICFERYHTTTIMVLFAIYHYKIHHPSIQEWWDHLEESQWPLDDILDGDVDSEPVLEFVLLHVDYKTFKEWPQALRCLVEELHAKVEHYVGFYLLEDAWNAREESKKW